MLRSELRYLPSRKITVHTIKKRCICSHFLRERCKQTRGFQQHIHTLIDVSHKYHRSSSSLFFFSTCKRTGCHVVFHNLDAIFILELDTCHFIKSNAVPQANQSNRFASHIVKEVCNCRLSTGNQDTIWRNLFVEMRLTSASRSQLAKIEIILNQWNHTGQKQPFLAICKFIRLHANRSEKNIQPFIFGKGFSSLLQLININMRHLDRCQFTDTYRRNIFLLFLFGTQWIPINVLNAKVIVTLNLIVQLNDTPDTTTEQSVKFFRVFVGNRYIANSQIGKLCKKAVLFHIQSNSHHINDRMTAFLSQLRQNLL